MTEHSAHSSPVGRNTNWRHTLGTGALLLAAILLLAACGVKSKEPSGTSPGFWVNPSTVSISETSGQDVDTVSVWLKTPPTDDVTIAVASSDTAQATVSPASLTFTATDYYAAQVITITAVDDALADGDATITLNLGIAASLDTAYDGLDPQDVAVTVLDNEVPGLLLSQTAISVSEAPGANTVTFTAVLTLAPTADVTIPLSVSDGTQISVDLPELLFTTGNWDIPQSVTVSATDDTLSEGDVNYQVRLGAAISGDTAYAGFDAGDVTVTVLDDDLPGVTVTLDPLNPGMQLDEPGGTAVFKVVLNTQPSATVSMSVAISDATEASLSTTTLTFNTALWNTPLPVTVTGLDDADIDGDTVLTVTIGATTSADPSYVGIVPAPVTVTVLDDELSTLDITALPAVGSVNPLNAHYKVTGLTAGAEYLVRLDAPADDADLVVYGADGTFTSPICAPRMAGGVEACMVAPTGTALYVQVDGANTSAATAYSLAVEPAFIANGTGTVSPTLLAGTVGYYKVTNLPIGAFQQVSLTLLDDDYDLYVYSQPSFSGNGCSSISAGTADESCLVASNADGALYVKVDGTAATLDSTFDLTTATPVPPTITATYTKGANLPATITGLSAPAYYKVDGLLVGANQTVSLTGITGDVDLWVYGDSYFSLLKCASAQAGTVDESCVVQANASGVLYVLVNPVVTPSDFTLNVQ